MFLINKYSQILTGKIAPMSETDRDPRPDIREDHILWASVLISAHKMDKQKGTIDTVRSIFGLLHGLRCAGAKLIKLDNGNLKLDYESLLDTWNKDVLLTSWLMPFRKEMATVFRRAVA